MKSKIIWTATASILLVWIAAKLCWAPPADFMAAARMTFNGVFAASLFFVFAGFLRDSLHDTRAPF